jgi:hypothetical protein
VPKDQGEFTESEKVVMEVQGFDLMEEVETLFGHVRQYQREVQRFRGLLGAGQTTTAHEPPLEAVRLHLRALREITERVRDTIGDLVTIVGDPDSSEPGGGLQADGWRA